MKRVTAGSPLSLSASAWNRHERMADWAEAQQINSGMRPGDRPINTGIVYAINKTGVALQAHSAVVLESSAALPSVDVNAFRGNTAVFYLSLWKDKDIDERHLWPIAVTQEPIDIEATGRVMVSGVTPANVTAANGDEEYAVPSTAANPTTMVGAYAGPAKILWKPAGGGWSILLLGHYPWINALPTYPYVIDRTDPDHDARAWDPGADLPGDWQDYDGVQLTIPVVRYTPGEATFFEIALQTYSWLTPYAPIIEPAVFEEPEVEEC